MNKYEDVVGATSNLIYAIINNVVSEEYIKERAAYANDIIDVSNDIISYNLVKELKGVCSRWTSSILKGR